MNWLSFYVLSFSYGDHMRKIVICQNTLDISIFLNEVYYIPISINKNMKTVMNGIVIDDNINDNHFGNIW